MVISKCSLVSYGELIEKTHKLSQTIITKIVWANEHNTDDLFLFLLFITYFYLLLLIIIALLFRGNPVSITQHVLDILQEITLILYCSR